MTISEAKKSCQESLARYQGMLEAGQGKNMDKKIALVQSQIVRLEEMELGGLSPFHSYTDLVEMWGITDFQPKIAR